MNPDCNILNPLQRDGTSQTKRLVRALHPTHVLADEREIDDFLVYARDYAQLIRYYSIENNPQGDWKVLIESDISVLVSLIANTQLEPIRDAFKQGATLADLFPPILQLAKLADEWYGNSVAGLSLNTLLVKVINSILNDALRNTISYGLRAQEIGLTIPAASLDISSIRSDIWVLDNIQPDPLLFPSDNPANTNEINQARERLRIEFQKIFDNLQSLIGQAPAFLEETLEKYPEHEPHMALFLAFLQVFKIARDHLNTITRRHLNFYYREVLGMEPLPAQPDDVHIIFNLAKGFDEFLVKENTDLNAGKDDNKANLFYATGEDLLVNKAQVDPEKGLKTIFIEKDYDTAFSTDIPYTIKNIYAAPVANSGDGLGADIEDEEGKWPTLGKTANPPATIGFAVASPMFLLKEGARHIQIKFSFNKPPGVNYNAILPSGLVKEELKQNIKVQYTGEKAWVDTSINDVVITMTSGSPTGSIKFNLELPPEKEPVVPYNPEVITDGLKTRLPVFRFLFDNEGLIPLDENLAVVADNIKQNANAFSVETSYTAGDFVSYQNQWYKYIAGISSAGSFPSQDTSKWFRFEKSYPYKYFQPLELSSLTIHLDVDDVQNLILENDVGTINPAKPFNPFGPIPKVGSKFFVGNVEVFQKKVDTLDLKISWADLPTDSFKNYYTKYNSGIPNNNNEFTVDIERLSDGNWSTFAGSSPKALFQSSTSNPPNPVSPLSVSAVLAARDLNPKPFSMLTPDLFRGFIRLKLNKNFLHKIYGPSVTTYVKTGSGDAPNEPYTPVFNSIKLDYTSEETIVYSKQTFKDRVEQLFHIGPFGWQEFFPFDQGVDPKQAVVSRKLIPEFPTPDPNAPSDQPAPIDAEGTLYIGLQDLEPDQTVSILFQVAEGSANPDKAKQDVVWSYMANNRWTDFESNQILADSTNGLLTSGIVTFAMPKQMVNTNTILPGGLHWIKASVARDTDAISQAIAIMTQAVKSTFRIQPDNDLDRLKQALPAETIAKLRERQAAIKKVLQPFASFNGKVQEQTEAPEGVEGDAIFNKEYNEFYIRVSERLRHKNRGVAIFDYERLVLQKFSDIYKVKCLNHTCIEYLNHPVYPDKAASEHAPGFVKIVVLPNLRNKNAVNPLEPKVSLNRLDEIKTYLQPLISDFVVLEVKNPVFEKIQVEFNVRFYPLQEANRGFYENLLNQEIIQFLSPWLYQEGEDLQLGGKIHRSVILNFIEEREYVDFLTDFKLHHIVSDTLTYSDVEEAVAASSSSVLVSALTHIIGDDINVACLNQPS